MELFIDSNKNRQNNQIQNQNPAKTPNQAKNTPNSEHFVEMGSEIKTLTARLRSLEEKYRNLRTSLQINEKNLLEDNKKKNAEMKDLNQEIFDLKKSFKETQDKMSIIIKELGLTSKKEEVETIQKYLNLWNPVHFVNQHEIVPIVRRALLELGIKSKNDIQEVQEPDVQSNTQNIQHRERNNIY